jgi:hypothetical protein
LIEHRHDAGDGFMAKLTFERARLTPDEVMFFALIS